MAVMSTGRYILLSALTAAAVVWHAFSTREQFFPSMVYLSSSKFSLAVLGNMGFALALATYKVLLRVFLGTLRDSEVERVNDKVGQAVVETCLAMTIFREDFTASFLSMFVILSFVKIFHWLVQDRVDFIETTPNVTRLQHIRIATFTLVLLAIDLTFLHYSLSKTLKHGVSVHLLFAFEYTVQASTIVLTFVKYCLSMVDMAMEGRWEGKGVAVFYLELTLDMLHLLVYCAFFAVVFSTYGIPLHLVRDLYWTFRNFQTRVRDFLRYRRITANMDHSFPDATAEELQRADHVCIICREEMTVAGRNKKLGCNHCFHLHCLRSWLERQQNCPICRRSVVPPTRQAAAAAAAPAAAAAAAAAAGGDQLAAAAGRMRAAAAENLAAAERAQADAAFHAGHAPAPGEAAAAAAGHMHAQAAAQQQQHNLRRRRSWRAQMAGAEVGAGGGGMPGMQGMAMDGWHMVAHYPQWVPATPMALYLPAGGLQQIQYAGQQHPEQVLQAQAAAAAAAAAAGLMPFLMPMQFMLPPFMAPPATLFQPPAAAPAGPQAEAHQQQQPAAASAATPQQHMAAAAAAAAAAASFLAPFGGGGGAGVQAPAHTNAASAAASAAAAAAMEQVLQQQLLALRAHQEQARQQVQQQEAANAAGRAGISARAAPRAPPSVGGSAGGPSASTPAAAGPPAAAAPPIASAAAAPLAAPAAVPLPAAAAALGCQVAEEEREEEEEEGEEGEARAIRRRRLERFSGAP